MQKIYLVIREIGFGERIVCSYTSREMAHLHVQLLENYMGNTPKLVRAPWPYNRQWLQQRRQREEYIQACPYDIGLKEESFGSYDDPPVYMVRETLLVRHPDEYLENITPS